MKMSWIVMNAECAWITHSLSDKLCIYTRNNFNTRKGGLCVDGTASLMLMLWQVLCLQIKATMHGTEKVENKSEMANALHILPGSALTLCSSMFPDWQPQLTSFRRYASFLTVKPSNKTLLTLSLRTGLAMPSCTHHSGVSWLCIPMGHLDRLERSLWHTLFVCLS